MWQLRTGALMPLEILHFTLVLLGCRTRGESAEIAALPGFFVLLAGVEAIFSRFEFANHGCSYFAMMARSIQTAFS